MEETDGIGPSGDCDGDVLPWLEHAISLDGAGYAIEQFVILSKHPDVRFRS